jgi:hypothetical protein
VIRVFRLRCSSTHESHWPDSRFKSRRQSQTSQESPASTPIDQESKERPERPGTRERTHFLDHTGTAEFLALCSAATAQRPPQPQPHCTLHTLTSGGPRRRRSCRRRNRSCTPAAGCSRAEDGAAPFCRGCRWVRLRMARRTHSRSDSSSSTPGCGPRRSARQRCRPRPRAARRCLRRRAPAW